MVRPLFSLLLSPRFAAAGSVVGAVAASLPSAVYTPYWCNARRKGPSRNVGIGPLGPNRDMMSPRPYTAVH